MEIKNLEKLHLEAIKMAQRIVDKSFPKKGDVWKHGDRMGAVMTVYNNLMAQFRTQAGFSTMKKVIDDSSDAMLKKMFGGN